MAAETLSFDETTANEQVDIWAEVQPFIVNEETGAEVVTAALDCVANLAERSSALMVQKDFPWERIVNSLDQARSFKERTIIATQIPEELMAAHGVKISGDLKTEHLPETAFTKKYVDQVNQALERLPKGNMAIAQNVLERTFNSAIMLARFVPQEETPEHIARETDLQTLVPIIESQWRALTGEEQKEFLTGRLFELWVGNTYYLAASSNSLLGPLYREISLALSHHHLDRLLAKDLRGKASFLFSLDIPACDGKVMLEDYLLACRSGEKLPRWVNFIRERKIPKLQCLLAVKASYTDPGQFVKNALQVDERVLEFLEYEAMGVSPDQIKGAEYEIWFEQYGQELSGLRDEALAMLEGEASEAKVDNNRIGHILLTVITRAPDKLLAENGQVQEVYQEIVLSLAKSVLLSENIGLTAISRQAAQQLIVTTGEITHLSQEELRQAISYLPTGNSSQHSFLDQALYDAATPSELIAAYQAGEISAKPELLIYLLLETEEVEVTETLIKMWEECLIFVAMRFLEEPLGNSDLLDLRMNIVDICQQYSKLGEVYKSSPTAKIIESD